MKINWPQRDGVIAINLLYIAYLRVVSAENNFSREDHTIK
jgi:hypothetical protein